MSLSPTASIWVRNGTLLVLSFVLSAVVNIVPQLFFARAAPEAKGTLLSLFLLSGTVAATLGVASSRAGLRALGAESGRRQTAVMVLMLAGTVAAFGGLFAVQSIALFVLLNLGIRFGANFATNHIDGVSVDMAGVEHRALNDQVSTGFRLLGMLLAPVWFGFLYEQSGLTAGLVGTLGVVALLSVVPMANHVASPAPAVAGGTDGVERVDFFVLMYGNLVYAAMYMFAANVVYLLSDYLGRVNAEQEAGVLILAVFMAATLTVFLRPLLFSSRTHQPVAVWRMLIPAVLLTGAVLLYLFKIASSFPSVLLTGLVVGVGYGSFQLDLREYVTRAREERGKSGFLTHYNNLANTGALLAFGTMLAVSAVCERSGADMNRWVLLTVLVFSLAIVPVVAMAQRASGQRSVPRAWLLSMALALGVVLRLFRVPFVKNQTAGEVKSLAYDLAFALEATVWLWWTNDPEWDALQSGWRAELKGYEPPGPAPTEPPADRVRVLLDNAEAFAVRRELYAEAERSIDLTTYLIYADATGFETARLLAERARAGVRVRVLVDDGIVIRSALDNPGVEAVLKELTDAGVEVVRHRDPARPYDMQHRKLLVIDEGRKAIIGGRNYGDAYSGSEWRDLDLLLEGPAAASCAALANTAFSRMEGAAVPPAQRYTTLRDGCGVVADMRGDIASVNPVLLWQLAAIDAATESVDIENAYFVCLDIVQERLAAAVSRGVRVRVLTNSPESNDVSSGAYAFFSRFPAMVESGVELWVRVGAGNTLHSKYLIADGRFVSVGSYNLNAYSARLGCEANVQLEHAPLAAELTELFEAELARARRVEGVAGAEAMVPTDPIAILCDRYLLNFL